ncbi:hypothetical protein EDB81DRAFT_204016 [Dactylonectria macrodidyma]|uniref:Uncharacterized protein n=1 Tax=Dactylonectria macrodidyma TaxID=307937 RepID=A0A9P9IMP3_9HYPO|nr:hypothetical protein EDB81DRAFT_204016 [Dactylonectria macrodidyma]
MRASCVMVLLAASFFTISFQIAFYTVLFYFGTSIDSLTTKHFVFVVVVVTLLRRAKAMTRRFLQPGRHHPSALLVIDCTMPSQGLHQQPIN